MAEVDNEKYLVRRPVYEAFGGVKNRQSPTMTFMSRRLVPEANYYIEIGWIYDIPEPNPSLHEHVHDFDEIVLHWGSDPYAPQVLGGEIQDFANRMLLSARLGPLDERPNQSLIVAGLASAASRKVGQKPNNEKCLCCNSMGHHDLLKKRTIYDSVVEIRVFR